MGNRQLRKTKDKILQIIFPKTCPICEEILQKEQEICESCRKKLEYIREPKCKKCGKPFETDDEEQTIREYCADCGKGRHSYDSGMAVFRYGEDIRESISRFKYHNRRTYADFYGQEMARKYGQKIKTLGIQVLIPVPISKRKMVRRGYNQAGLIAKVLGETLNIPVDSEILIRDRDTTPQKELSNEERRKNLNNAFKMMRSAVKYKKVLLVDDIYTTGSTIDACAETLKRSGAGEIYFISLSIGAGI